MGQETGLSGQPQDLATSSADVRDDCRGLIVVPHSPQRREIAATIALDVNRGGLLLSTNRRRSAAVAAGVRTLFDERSRQRAPVVSLTTRVRCVLREHALSTAPETMI